MRIAVLSFLLSGLCLAQADAQSIRGRITDAQTGQPLGNVNLALVDTPEATASDETGGGRAGLSAQ